MPSTRNVVSRFVVCLVLFVFGSLSDSAQAQTADRGFGKLVPGYQSFYYVRKQLPFYLVDNEGRNAAEILVYVKSHPGAVIQHKLYGNEQRDLDVPLKIVVRNLTQDCPLSVEWVDFSFREDGQASSRGIQGPPGSTLTTTVYRVLLILTLCDLLRLLLSELGGRC